MDTQQALQLLGVNENANEQTVMDAFAHKRDKLEGLIFQAPTPALKEKYRSQLDTLKQAFDAIASQNIEELPVIVPQMPTVDEPSSTRVPAASKATALTRAKLPYRFLGTAYFTAEELAEALIDPDNWQKGLEHYQDGRLGKWVTKQFEDEHYGYFYNKIHNDPNLGEYEDSLRFALLCLLLSPKLPVVIKGEQLDETVGILGDINVLHTSDTIALSFPDYVQELAGRRELVVVQGECTLRKPVDKETAKAREFIDTGLHKVINWLLLSTLILGLVWLGFNELIIPDSFKVSFLLPVMCYLIYIGPYILRLEISYYLSVIFGAIIPFLISICVTDAVTDIMEYDIDGAFWVVDVYFSAGYSTGLTSIFVVLFAIAVFTLFRKKHETLSFIGFLKFLPKLVLLPVWLVKTLIIDVLFFVKLVSGKG